MLVLLVVVVRVNPNMRHVVVGAKWRFRAPTPTVTKDWDMQAPKRTQKLPMTEKEVIGAKKLLLEGHTIVNVAKFYDRSTECISRLKRGLSHKHVVVEGEARLWQPNPIIGERDDGAARPLTEMEAAAQAATLEKLMRVQEELDGPAAAPVGQPVSREALDAEAARLKEEEVRRVREEAKREGAGYGE